MKRALYPGSFDPVTFGHIDLIKRASEIFDEVIVAVLDNSAKIPLFSVEERVNMIFEVFKEYNNISVMSYDGLLVDFAMEQEAPTIVRGLRIVTDFEYELQMAQTNRLLSNRKVDTMFLATSLEYSYLSSSTVREVASYGGDISKFVPEFVAELVTKRMHEAGYMRK